MINKIIKGVWPVTRNILFRPDRIKYVTGLVKESSSCVFCDAEAAGPSWESLMLWRSELSMVVLNKYPYNNGHILVLPRRHIGRLDELSSEEYGDLMDVLRKAVEAVSSAYSQPSFNIGMNMGKVAGAGIPGHLHWHVVPRWSGDTNFFPVVAQGKVLAESLQQTYQRLLPHFS